MAIDKDDKDQKLIEEAAREWVAVCLMQIKHKQQKEIKNGKQK